MLTGKRAFDGPSAASVIAGIMERPAPSIAEVAPPALDRLLQRCLAKDSLAWNLALISMLCAFSGANIKAEVPGENNVRRYKVVRVVDSSCLPLGVTARGDHSSRL